MDLSIKGIYPIVESDRPTDRPSDTALRQMSPISTPPRTLLTPVSSSGFSISSQSRLPASARGEIETVQTPPTAAADESLGNRVTEAKRRTARALESWRGREGLEWPIRRLVRYGDDGRTTKGFLE